MAQDTGALHPVQSQEVSPGLGVGGSQGWHGAVGKAAWDTHSRCAVPDASPSHSASDPAPANVPGRRQ